MDLKNSITKNCQRCNKQFQAGRYLQKFCSNECRYETQLERQKCKEVFNRFMIYERDGFRCFYCGKSSIEDHANLIVEHVVSFGPARTNDPSNLVTACFTCNSEKGCRVLPESTLKMIQAEIKKRNDAFDLKDYHEKFFTSKHAEQFKNFRLIQ